MNLPEPFGLEIGDPELEELVSAGEWKQAPARIQAAQQCFVLRLLRF